MNNSIRNLGLGLAVFAGLSVMSSSSFAQVTSNSLEKRLLALEKTTQDQQTRIQALEAKLKYVTVNGTDMIVTGANLHVRNGTGSMATTNGLGNLIVGYNENDYAERTGSHNFLMGRYLNYTGYGSIVTGEGNTARGYYSSILSGNQAETSANGYYSSLIAANDCLVTKSNSAIVASSHSEVNSYLSVIVGGESNTISGNNSAIVGGEVNKILYPASFGTIAGGRNNLIGNGAYDNITGGYNNQVHGFYSAISAGQGGFIEASVYGGSISGGDQNRIHNNYSSIGGGHDLITTINAQFKGGGLTG